MVSKVNALTKIFMRGRFELAILEINISTFLLGFTQDFFIKISFITRI